MFEEQQGQSDRIIMIEEEIRKRCSQRDGSGPDYVDLTVHDRIFVFYSKKKGFEIQRDRIRFMLVEKNYHKLGSKAKGWLCVLSLLYGSNIQ